MDVALLIENQVPLCYNDCKINRVKENCYALPVGISE